MNMYKHIVFLLFSLNLSAQQVKLSARDLQAVGSYVSDGSIKGYKAIRVVKDSTVIKDDEPTYAKVNGIEFTEGIIEVKVWSKLLKNAPEHARGFIGIAFHINNDNSRFEAIYLRPANAMAEDQLRRNRSIQYFAYPDFKFTDSRKTAPGAYESYEDMELNQWITMKIVVKGEQAKLFLDGREAPSLIVNDLKLGKGATGGIGLFVDIGTEGFFKDLMVRGE